MPGKFFFNIKQIIVILLAFFLAGCGGFGGPIVPDGAPQADERFAEVKIAVIEAKSLVLATYRSIPPNVESGLWSTDFGKSVYYRTEQLEEAISLVELAVASGDASNVEARAALMSRLILELRNLTTGDLSYGGENHAQTTGHDHQFGWYGDNSGDGAWPDSQESLADGSRWTAFGLRDLSDERNDRAGQAKSEKIAWHQRRFEVHCRRQFG